MGIIISVLGILISGYIAYNEQDYYLVFYDLYCTDNIKDVMETL